MLSAPRFLLLAASPLPVARAAGASLLFPDLSQADPVSYIVAGFNYVAGLIAALVVLVALFGIIKRMASPGSSSAQSEAKNIFWNLAGGFLLFVLAYVFFTQILSPDLGTLRLPTLKALQDMTPGTGSGGPLIDCTQAGGNACATSPQDAKVLACMRGLGVNATATTFQGTHNGANSCHFGGANCKRDGSHAIDWGANSLAASGVSLQQGLDDASKCLQSTGYAATSQCRCESEGGAQINIPCDSANANHVHCNVDTASCGCN